MYEYINNGKEKNFHKKIWISIYPSIACIYILIIILTFVKKPKKRKAGEILKFLEEEKLVHHSKDKWFWTSDGYPADEVSLRSISSDNFVVVDTSEKTKAIAEVDFSSALTTLHP